jgi:uncharacterized protein (TIGR00251 family)
VTLPEIKQQLAATGEVRLKVKVAPKSGHSGIAGVMADGTLKVRVHSPPERGKANAEVCALVAAELGVKPRDVVILSGETSRLKQLRVAVR